MKTITATYLVTSHHIASALQAFTRGQSVGNPTILTQYETRTFLNQWLAKGDWTPTATEYTYIVRIDWPEHNFGTEGVNYLLSVLMGGQCDIDLIEGCRLLDLSLGQHTRHFPKPRYGLQGIRELLHITDRPFIGGILKPKIGLTPRQVAEVVKQMVDGGCDFIKEDEILADQYWCRMEDRLPLVAKVCAGSRTLYAACVTGDGSDVWKKARRAVELGASAIHLNLWCGLGTYLDVRKHSSLPLFFQKSGDKVWTTGPYSIDYSVICQLVYLAGCDFAHVGMYGGYLAESKTVLERRLKQLNTTIPSFSCGMTPELAQKCVELFGPDIMVTSGGWIHGHPEGVTEGIKQLRRAVDGA